MPGSRTGFSGLGHASGSYQVFGWGATLLVPLVLRVLDLAWRQRWETHRAIARWTWPIWVYVSVSGVLIYLLLCQIFPQR